MSKKPDYRLKILNKTNDRRNNNAGAGWLNKDNSITLILNPGIQLTDSTDYVFTLFTDYEAYE